MSKKITINDIAKLAGVSRTTVSHFLNDVHGSMSEQTRQRIGQTVEMLGYRPSRQARALRSQSSSTIGVVVADISNSYTSRLIKGILNGLDGTRYNTIIMDSGNSKVSEQKNIKKMLSERVDGLIFEPLGCKTEDYSILRDAAVPTVQIDRYTEPLIWDAVVSDNFEQSKILAELLIAKGYQRIAVVSDPIFDVTVRSTRYAGIEEALKGTDVKLERFIKTDVTMWDDLRARISDDIRTVIYAFNGDGIFDVMNFLDDEHIPVPQAVGVVGYDGAPWTKLVVPGITAVEQDPIEIGRVAATKLIGLVDRPVQDAKDATGSGIVEAEIITVDSRLVERQSLR